MKRIPWFSLVSLFVIFLLMFSPTPAKADTIYVSGTLTGAQTWTTGNLYIVDGDLTVDAAGTLTIQPGVQIKVAYGFGINVNGKLVLQGTAGNPVIFTSNRDNSVGEDTDPSSILPAAGDWNGITLIYTSAASLPGFQYATIRYGSTALTVQNLSGLPIEPPINQNTIEFNKVGMLIKASDGDFNSTVQGNQIQNNESGMQVMASSLGFAFISLNSNSFKQNSAYPLELWGNSFPLYFNNTFEDNGYQGIAMKDVIDLSSPLELVPANPNPGAAILPYVVPDYLEIAAGATLQFPAGLVMKFGFDGLLEVNGQLDLLGDAPQPIVFTSLYDDAYGGDTDGQVGDPTNNRWYGVELRYSGGLSTTTFSHTILRYSDSGLMVTNAHNLIYSPSIHNNLFDHNGVGISMLAADVGNIAAAIQDNQILSNGTGVKIDWTGANIGVIESAIHNNNFVYNTLGVDNLQPGQIVNAENNWWGSSTGPRHNTNPSGTGDPVSDRVDFNPYLSTPSFPPTYILVMLPLINK